MTGKPERQRVPGAQAEPAVSRAPVLLYHRISRRPRLAGTWVSPHMLADQLEALLDAGFRPLTAERWLQARPADLRCGFLITFDDGTEDLYRYREILAKRGVPAVVFVPVDLLGRRNDWEWPLPTRRARHLDTQELRALAAAGWEVGVHGASHRVLTRLPVAELRVELASARRRLADLLGLSITLLSYPYGRTDVNVVAVAAKAGFQAGFVVSRAPGTVSDPWAVVRRPVYCIDTPGTVLVKVRDPEGLTWRGRWELWKERCAHGVGIQASGWRSEPTAPRASGDRPG